MFQISIDTGGTFTDGILLREDGTVSIAKTESTPDNFSRGIMDCVKALAQCENGMSAEQLLAKTGTVTIGSTAATNAVLQLKGAKIGMITTKNFRDILEFRRIVKKDLLDLKLPKPVILVPRYLRIGVEERMKHTGEVITPLDEDEVRQAVAKLKANDCEVVAVCFLHSYANPEHERRTAEIVREEYPGAEVVLSSNIVPKPMEFERFNTTVLAAYISPLCSAFLKQLEKRLKDADFKGALLVMTSNAGVTTAEVAMERPILMISSGPSAGPLLASIVGKDAGFENILFADIGGTSYDISLLPKGRIRTTTDGIVGDQRNASETVEVLSVGTGGGTIARLDLRGILCIGPESAGADPGPACYGKGGQSPTVTDADVVLGYIPVDNFLGGEVKLDLELAKKVIQKQIGDHLGCDAVEAAYAMRFLVDGMMAEETFLTVTDRGYDPRNFVICTGGGAGPTHMLDVAKRLHIKEVYIPKVSSVFCAYGMTCADFKHEASQFASYIAEQVDLNELTKIYQAMEKEKCALLDREGVARDAIRIRRGGDMQYFGQIHGVAAWMPERGINGPVTKDDLAALIEAFHQRHEEMYGHADRNMPTAFSSIRLEAIGIRPKVKMAEQPRVGKDPSGALKRKRPAYFKELGGFVETPCYDGDKLQNGNVITGPAIVEEKTTTLVIPPGATVSVDRYGNYFGKLE